MPRLKSSRSPSAAALAAGLFALALGTSGCQIFAATAVSFFSEPPGARVIVDRKDSGFVTPCRITLPRDPHKVELELPGYAPSVIELTPETVTETVYWRDMALTPRTWKFPLWLDLEGTFAPVTVHKTLAPGRVFVRLERAAAP